MKKLVLLSAFGFASLAASAQCTTTNATSCQCQNSQQTNCDLLPDITISWQGISNGGYIEYSQTSTDMTYNQGPNAGRLRVTGSTPNIGHGPLTARGVDSLGQRWFICGTDTFTINDPNSTQQFVCPNGNPTPHQIIFQRIYHKNGNTMTYREEPAGTMTYHPSHGHNHVDAWGVFTLRIEDPNDPNPTHWPIVGQGQKMGFCLMDYGQCGSSSYIGHCRDTNTVYNFGNIMVNADFPNWGLGGGQYNCSQVEQGISSGWTDVYSKSLDGMWINIPPGTCNGNYWIVVDVDPNNNFVEEDETNNYTAIPVTLTQQLSSNPILTISADRNPVICPNENITLTASAGTAFLWSNGATTQSITVSQPGNYTCQVTTFCGTGTAVFDVYSSAAVSQPVAPSDTVCVNTSATLTASGPGTLNWYDMGGNFVGTGATFVTNPLTASTTYYVESVLSQNDSAFAQPFNKNMGSGSNVTSAQYEIFNAYSAGTLLDVKIYANAAGNVTIQLQDSTGAMLQTATVALVAGEQRVTLNFPFTPGNNYRLASTGTNPGLFRNDGGVSYPYDMPGVLRITNSSAGLARYYYFYDWHVATTNETCTSVQTAVPVFVDACTGLGEDPGFRASLSIAPNPNNGVFNLSFNATNRADVAVYVTDLTGRAVYNQTMQGAQGRVMNEVNLANLSKGVYMLSVVYEGKAYVEKVVIH
ncbi:MAG: T9SS type A sorting domain-containing protein [Bacteroidia bacterium]